MLDICYKIAYNECNETEKKKKIKKGITHK